MNLLINKFKSKKHMIGTWNTLASPLVTEVLASSGLNFQIIDLEHGPFAIDQIHLHISAINKYEECLGIVRLPKIDDWMILQALDQGAHGIIVPHVNNKADAENLVSFSKYSPMGQRGFSPFTKAGNFNDKEINKHIQNSNDLLLGVIIESVEGLDNLNEILEVNEIDLVYFGAYDISQSLGFPGDVKNPEVLEILEDGISKVKQVKKICGGFVAKDEEDVKWLVDMGIDFVTYQTDSLALYEAMNSISNFFEKFR